MSPKPTVALSINACWNVLNFRAGLVAALREAGHEVVVIAPQDESGARLADLGVRLEAVPMDVSGRSVWRDLRLMLAYRRLLKRLRPQVYLGYTAKPNIYGSLAAHSLGIPVINNVAGLGTAFIKGGALGCLVANLYRLAFRRSRTVFFQNDEDRDLFVSSGLVKPERARLLPGSGIDLVRFQPAPLPSPQDAPVFLLIARVLRDKGVVEYAEAAKLLKSSVPGARFQLLGFLNAKNATAISQAEVAAWVAEGAIEYLGDANDVRPFIAAADCVVLPSYREGLPRTMLEGAAMARPLVATNVPGCRHVVRDGVNGYLCKVRDARSLADAMGRVAALTPEARIALGRAGRAMVEAEFDERIVIERYLAAVVEAIHQEDT